MARTAALLTLVALAGAAQANAAVYVTTTTFAGAGCSGGAKSASADARRSSIRQIDFQLILISSFAYSEPQLCLSPAHRVRGSPTDVLTQPVPSASSCSALTGTFDKCITANSSFAMVTCGTQVRRRHSLFRSPQSVILAFGPEPTV